MAQLKAGSTVNGKVIVVTDDARLSVATTLANGLMSSTDKSKLNGIDSGASKITLGTVQPTVGWWFKEI